MLNPWTFQLYLLYAYRSSSDRETYDNQWCEIHFRHIICAGPFSSDISSQEKKKSWLTNSHITETFERLEE